MRDRLDLRVMLVAGWVMWALVMSGCVAQQADLKQTERSLQQKIKQSNDELLQTRARQSQELTALREQELPQLRDQLERAQHQAQDLQNKQDDLKQRSAVLEQQTKKLEQLAGKLDADNLNRYTQVRESLNAQDIKNKEDRDRLRGDVNTRLDEINRQMETLRKEILEAVQKTNSAVVKSVDARFEEQRKSLADSQVRTEQLSNRFTQFNQSLTGFKESLTTLADKVGQEEQNSKALAAKLETDTRSSSAHINETTKTLTGHLNEVNKSVAAVAQKLATHFDEQVNDMNASMASSMQKVSARLDEQDRRVESLNKAFDQVSRDAQAAVAASKNGQSQHNSQPQQNGHAQQSGHDQQNGHDQQPTKPAHRSSGTSQSSSAPSPQESSGSADKDNMTASLAPEQTTHHAQDPSEKSSPVGETQEASRSAPARAQERPDRTEYERLLGSFRDGDLEGARRGFTAFLGQYPNSELAPNARYWLGESHYGKKDYKQAIDAYDRVEMDYPQSEKVPAAILKKGYAYLALKDKKRASSAFKQVVTLYPKSPEAGKAYDKLSQLKELR